MNIRLDGKVALVTGASGGIGRAAAIQLGRAGARVAVNYFSRRDEALQTAVAITEAGGEAEIFQADVTKGSEIEALVVAVEQRFGGPIEILVNNAGDMVKRCLNAEMTEELYERVMNVNVKSTVFVSKAVLDGMKRLGRGVIVNMSSLAAHNGGANGSSVYAASKAAVTAYSKGLAKEAAPFGIRVNLVSPGLIGQTLFHDTHTSAEARKATIAGIPLGREGTPDDVAAAIVFLASDASSFLTGETIEINGGAFMR